MDTYRFLDAIFGYFKQENDETDDIKQTPLDTTNSKTPQQNSDHAIIDNNDEGFDQNTLEASTNLAPETQQKSDNDSIEEEFYETVSELNEYDEESSTSHDLFLEEPSIMDTDEEFFDALSELNGDDKESSVSHELSPKELMIPSEERRDDFWKKISDYKVFRIYIKEFNAKTGLVTYTRKSFMNMDTIAYWDSMMGRVPGVVIPQGAEALFEIKKPMEYFRKIMENSSKISKSQNQGNPMSYKPRLAKPIILTQKDCEKTATEVSPLTNNDAKPTEKKEKDIKSKKSRKFALFKKKQNFEYFNESLLENEQYFNNDYGQMNEIDDDSKTNHNRNNDSPKKKGLKRRIMKILTLSKIRRAIRANKLQKPE